MSNKRDWNARATNASATTRFQSSLEELKAIHTEQDVRRAITVGVGLTVAEFARRTRLSQQSVRQAHDFPTLKHILHALQEKFCKARQRGRCSGNFAG